MNNFLLTHCCALGSSRGCPIFIVYFCQLSGGISNSGQMPTICGTNNGQHVIYSAIPSFPARLSVVVDTMVSKRTKGNLAVKA